MHRKSSRGGSKLDALVAQDQQWQNQGNTSLAYKPLSRSEIKRRAEAEAAAARALQSPQATTPSSTSTPANNNLKLAVPGNLIRYDSGNPVALGPKGLALLNIGPGQFTLIIYDLQTQQQEVVVMLTDAFELLVQPNNYCSFWDATPTLWAFQLASAEVQQALITHVALAKFHYTVAANQSKCIVSNLAPVQDTARVLATGDAVKLSYTMHLVENAQMCPAPTTDLSAILGQSVEVRIEISTVLWDRCYQILGSVIYHIFSYSHILHSFTLCPHRLSLPKTSSNRCISVRSSGTSPSSTRSSAA